MNDQETTELEQYIKENLKAERMIKLSITYQGKEYNEQVSIEQLFKVYERVMKREYIFATKIPPTTLESLKQRILADIDKKNDY
jgi:hypothetical protein